MKITEQAETWGKRWVTFFKSYGVGLVGGWTDNCKLDHVVENIPVLGFILKMSKKDCCKIPDEPFHSIEVIGWFKIFTAILILASSSSFKPWMWWPAAHCPTGSFCEPDVDDDVTRWLGPVACEPSPEAELSEHWLLQESDWRPIGLNYIRLYKNCT